MGETIQRMSDAFASEEWRVLTDALFDTLGIVVTAVDVRTGAVVHAGPRASYCRLVSRGSATGVSLLECFDEAPDPEATQVSRVTCRIGMPCLVVPLEVAGRVDLQLVVEGFVTSTRERRRLFENLISRGLDETEARMLVRDVPVYSAHKAERFAELVAVQARHLLSLIGHQSETLERVSELEALVEAGRDFADSMVGYHDLPAAVLERGMRLVGAGDGVLMMVRQGTDILEVVATRGQHRTAAPGSLCRVGDGVPGHVAETGRSVLVTGGSAWPSVGPGEVVAAVTVPLQRSDRLVGVLSLGFSDPTSRITAGHIGVVERYAEFAASALDNAKYHEEAERELMELTQLNEVTRAIHADQDVDGIVRVIASVMEKAMDFEIGGVALTGHGLERSTVVVRSTVGEADIDAVLEEATGLACDGEEERVYVTHLGEVTKGLSHPDWTVLSAALPVRDLVIGHLFVASSVSGSFDSQTERLLCRLADQVALAVDRAVLMERLRNDYTKTIAALSAALDAAEHRDAGHTLHVMDYAMALAEELDLTIEEIELLRFAGLLHDVGKVGLSEEILLKPAKLTTEEMAKVKLHSQIGASLVEQIDFLNSVAPLILHHHEHWDGGGYPTGLAGDEIPLLARILCIADAYDAMTNKTPYRTALSLPQARSELEAGAGVQFDPRLVAKFCCLLDRRIASGLTGLFSEAARSEPQLPS